MRAGERTVDTTTGALNAQAPSVLLAVVVPADRQFNLILSPIIYHDSSPDPGHTPAPPLGRCWWHGDAHYVDVPIVIVIEWIPNCYDS